MLWPAGFDRSRTDDRVEARGAVMTLSFRLVRRESIGLRRADSVLNAPRHEGGATTKDERHQRAQWRASSPHPRQAYLSFASERSNRGSPRNGS
jgi:hypothetical protein